MQSTEVISRGNSIDYALFILLALRVGIQVQQRLDYAQVESEFIVRKYLLRNEGGWALKGLGINGKGPAAWDGYMQGLLAELPRSFEDPMDTEVHELDDHTARMREVVNGDFSVSLDPCIKGKRQLGISRQFLPGGRQDIGIAARPGFPDLERQIASLPTDQPITLVEDDIFTGGTMRRIIAQLRSRGVQVAKVIVGIQVGTPELDVPVIALDQYEHEEVFDLSDPRDFLLGAHGSGLVVRCDDGELVRAPYLYPFVDVAARCSMSSAAATEFSRVMWEHNVRFWERFERVRVCDLEMPTRRFLEREGYGRDATVASICRKMADAKVSVE